MPLPVNYNTGRVKGQYHTLDGSPVAGTIRFRLNVTRLVDADALLIILPYELTAVLDSQGAFDVNLPATNDPDINPTDFTYTVIEDMPNGHTYSIAVPVDAVIDLSSVVAVEATTGFASITGPQGPPGVGINAYQHAQPTPAATWVINHNQERKPPSIAIIGTDGDQVSAEVEYTSNNVITVKFNEPFAGDAYF